MGLRYLIAALLSRRDFTINWLKFRDVGRRKPVFAKLRPGKLVCPSGVIKKWLIVYLYITYDKNALLIATIAIGIFLSMTSSDLFDYDSFIF